MPGLTKNEFQVKWHIERAECWFETRDDTIYSPQFLADTLMHTRWKLSLCPNWQLAEKYVSLAVQRDIEDDHTELIELNYELSFLASDGTPIKLKTGTKKFAPKTMSHKLNVKHALMLDEKNEAYLSERVLTVCCKLWKRSTVSKRMQCSMRSEIGIHRINVKSQVDGLFPPFAVSVNFMLPMAESHQISLDIFVNDDKLLFQKKNVELKSFNYYSCKLFALNGKGYRTEFDEIWNLTKRLNLTSNNASKLASISHGDFLFRYLPHGGMTLELEVEYCPGIQSEKIESKFSCDEKLSCGEMDLKTLDLSESDSFGESESSHEDDDSQSSCEDVQVLSIDEDSSTSFENTSPQSTTFKEDFASLYATSFFSDIKLQTDVEVFAAHRCVLSARSPVFKKMFIDDMGEKAIACIDIPDIKSDTVQKMLQFLYTDSIQDLKIPNAKDLYFAAQKYEIATLKQRCSSFMKENLSASNVCAILVLADTHQDKDLLSVAQKFILKNGKEVFLSEEWKLFMDNFSELAAQVMYLKCIKE